VSDTNIIKANGQSRHRLETAVLLCILVLGAGLRFYNLGLPSMWWDEILVPLIVRFPAASILEWLRHVEVHPPLYYFLTKAVMHLDTSEQALRLFSAVPGVLSLYAIYRIGKDNLGSGAGLAAAALLAANPYAIWLSRIVRPYSLFLFFFLVSLWALGAWMRSRESRWLLLLAASNLVLFWTHYMMVVLAPAFCLVVAVGAWPRLKPTLLLAAATAASFLSILPFFLQNFTRPHWLGPGNPLDILAGVGVNAAKLAWFFRGPVCWTILALAVLGAILAARRERGALLAALALAATPVAAVMAGKLAWTHEPRYFLFLMPLILLAAGYALSRAASGVRLPVPVLSLLILAGLTALVAVNRGTLYDEESRMGIGWIDYRTSARMVQTIVRPGEPVMVSEEGLYNALDWYLQARGGPDPLRVTRITPQDKETVLNFLWFERMGHLAATPKELFAAFPGLVDVGTVGLMSFFKVAIQREPVIPAGPLPWETVFRGPRDFVGRCLSMENLALTPFWGGELQPAANGAPGVVEFRVANKDLRPQRIELAVRYTNEGEGNTLKVLARFDEEPWVEAAASQGPDAHAYRRVFLDRDKPYSTLTVRVEMTCAMLTAHYPGGNLDSLRLHDLLVALSPRDNNP